MREVAKFIIEIFMTSRLLIATSCSANPIEVITSIALPEGAVRTNDPSVVVAVAILVPFTSTVAPDNGLPASSVTLQDTLKLFCEKEGMSQSKAAGGFVSLIVKGLLVKDKDKDVYSVHYRIIPYMRKRIKLEYGQAVREIITK